MCSPELTKGMCCICYGTLTPDNTYADRFGNVWDLHKGVCAYHVGEVPDRHQPQYAWYMGRLKSCSSSVRQDIIRSLYRWIEQVADENHYDMSGPK